MTANLRDERGFTLVELLSAMMVGSIVLVALFGIIDVATRQQAKAVDRIQTTAGGRSAIDTISQQLASRVCVSQAQGSLVSASDSQIEFYASFGLTTENTTESQSLVVQRRRLTYRPTPDNDIREEVWLGSAAPPAEPTRTRTLLTKVSLVGTTPFFRYYAVTDEITGVALANPLLLTPTPLSAPNLLRAAQINVSFSANGKVPAVRSELQTQILDRSPACSF